MADDEIKDKFRKLFTEVKEVLNEHGEFRFDSEGWIDDVYKTSHSQEPLPPIEERAQNAWAFLQEIEPGIVMDWGIDVSRTKVPFFILKKD